MKPVQLLLALLLVFLVSVRAAKADLPVIDPSAIVKLVEQINQFKEMISTLESQRKMLKHYLEIDHDGLADSMFFPFLNQLQESFDQVFEHLNCDGGSYQGGGLLCQIDRLDEVYPAYHEDWDQQDKDKNDPFAAQRKTLKKELLWTKIQMKHAAMVASEVRKAIPQTQEHLEKFLDDTNQSQGLLLSLNIGNEINGLVVDSIQKVNVQLNEMLQAQIAHSLEENQQRGKKVNDLKDLMKGWSDESNANPVEMNPIH